MRVSTVLASLAACVLAGAQTTGQLGDAQKVTDNPAGADYQAVLNSAGNAIRGSVVASSVGNGQGVQFQVALSGLPAESGPFLYHIHAAPVPTDGNCTGTLAHLDPYIRGEDPGCDASEPQTCQVGDLSGKHGKINSTAISASYVDNYVSLKPGVGAFFGNRSLVIHFANKTRIACANFTAVATCDGCTPTPIANLTGSAGSTGTPGATGSAGSVGGSTSGIVATATSSMYSSATNAAAQDGVVRKVAAALGFAMVLL